MVSWRRNRAAASGEFELDALAHDGREPESARRFAKNLNNQFELPMLFYALIAILYATAMITSVQVVLAWIFLCGRVAHTIVQTNSDNVTLRGIVFSINFVALALMWLVFFLSRWEMI